MTEVTAEEVLRLMLKQQSVNASSLAGMEILKAQVDLLATALLALQARVDQLEEEVL